MQRRLLEAAQWIGKARRDSDRAKGFVQLLFALEAMLQIQEKGVLLSPSIGYRLQETCAFVVGTDHVSRSEIARIVSDLYETRSAVVHGGTTAVDDVKYWRGNEPRFQCAPPASRRSCAVADCDAPRVGAVGHANEVSLGTARPPNSPSLGLLRRIVAKCHALEHPR